MRRPTGRWRIVEMDLWDRDAIDLVEPGFIDFADDGTGQFGFIAVRGAMDCRTTERDDRTTVVEFSWDGDDEGDQVSGRGWAALVGDATLEGHLFIHLGDDSGFRAEPFARADRQERR
ncbi:hypothetical protein ACWEK5_44830 [Rhodococcus koreensis]